MKNILTLIVVALLFTACKKEMAAPSPGTSPTNQTFPNYVTSDPRGEYYIEGTFNGKKICMSPSVAPRDTFSNVYYYVPEISLNQLNMLRTNDEASAEMQMYMGQSDILTRTMPYSTPNDHLVTCEFTQFQFYDVRHRRPNENDQYDDFTYQASTNTGMQLTVTKFEKNVLEGTFAGVLKTNTGKMLTVTDGAFRIKIFIVTSLY